MVGLINITMTTNRENWISGLRQLTKKLTTRCHGRKRLQNKPFAILTPGYLPKSRTKQTLSFEVVGADYAGPIYCKTKSKREVKVYMVLFTCSVSRAIYLEISINQTTGEFIKARRGGSQITYSDNAKTFTAREKWINKINMDKHFKDYLARGEIRWKFSLAKTPWWGGTFEQMI